jgi:hypothetical protein
MQRESVPTDDLTVSRDNFIEIKIFLWNWRPFLVRIAEKISSTRLSCLLEG